MWVLIPRLGLSHARCWDAVHDHCGAADLDALGRGLEVLNALVDATGDVAALAAATAGDGIDEVGDYGGRAGLEEGDESGESDGGDLSGIHFASGYGGDYRSTIDLSE